MFLNIVAIVLGLTFLLNTPTDIQFGFGTVLLFMGAYNMTSIDIQ